MQGPQAPVRGCARTTGLSHLLMGQRQAPDPPDHGVAPAALRCSLCLGCVLSQFPLGVVVPGKA